MKRQKRDMQLRAYQRGYRNGLMGRPEAGCPHNQGESRRQWLTGWHEGRRDAWDGYGVVSAMQKMAMR